MATAPTATPSVEDVLSFWFANQARWWKKDAAFDAEIRSRFLGLHEAIERGECRRAPFHDDD